MQPVFAALWRLLSALRRGWYTQDIIWHIWNISDDLYNCEMQLSDLLDYKLGFVSENTFSFTLGFLLPKKHVLFQISWLF